MAKILQKLAVFDIDGTIFRSSLTIQLINQLIRSGVFPRSAAREMAKDYQAWLNRQGSYESYIAQNVKILNRHIAGCSKTSFDAAARAVLKSQKDEVYRFTRSLLRRLKKQKYFLLAISGSPQEIVSRFGRLWGFDLALGSVYEHRSGKFTGRVLNLDTVYQKAEVVKKVIKLYNLRAGLKSAIAVGDTESDIALLKLVGRPFAFNPNQKLACAAKKYRWPIVVERKNVIFSLKKFKFIYAR